jgi:hypothetical protein
MHMRYSSNWAARFRRAEIPQNRAFKLDLTMVIMVIIYMYDLLFYSISLFFSATTLIVQKGQQEREAVVVDTGIVERVFGDRLARQGSAGAGRLISVSVPSGFVTTSSSEPREVRATDPCRTATAGIDLLDSTEAVFFAALKADLGCLGYTAMAKVNLADVINGCDLAADERGDFEQSASKMGRRHVDFVVCHGNTLRVVAVLRLRPPGLLRPLHVMMARKVDRAIEASGIPVVRVNSANAYAENEIASTIMQRMT